VEAGNAIPTDGGTQWVLRQEGSSCNGPSADELGANQFAFKRAVSNAACDPLFDASATSPNGRSAAAGQSADETKQELVILGALSTARSSWA
jgi:hypothetical protein